ncbi:Bis(5'-adenosyl)-triphosphatase [Tetrabaena socialis]|uniref:Bis(5'-adenosyl)-triphosphatase n=1 Tax=Tetrabaena socialis TaxID=47790 RepID=A0A2J8A6V3_9CHLO|nr:Bis(5'-adenosyl)-triphosphatase [Tetrabaena socialis]|eukprot:PNH08266.1 Bis(5'-adenosyl)-triphosphatase [Tetrabaena socialis]
MQLRQASAASGRAGTRSRVQPQIVCRAALSMESPLAEELKKTAAYISQKGKGILASDESNATTGKRLEVVGIENTEENRRDWRQLLYTAPGLDAPVATPQEVARVTVRTMMRSIPAAVPGIHFLSGGMAEEEATLNLQALNDEMPNSPWALTFSYGRALQSSTLKTWAGKEANWDAAQAILVKLAKANSEASTGSFKGPHPVPGGGRILQDLSYGFVNLKPVVPGHVLVSPRRPAKRFQDLNAEEVADLWLLAQRIGTVVERQYGAGSLTLAIQDGPLAGQTVPHVHIHVLPRKAGDFPKNDEVYDAIDQGSADFKKAAQEEGPSEKLDLDKERQVRTHSEMAEEAAVLRALLA